MRRNRRKQVKANGVVSKVAVLVVVTLTLMLTYWRIDSQCNVLGQEINENEKRLRALDGEIKREEAHWNEKNTPEKLEEAMRQHGIAMDYAKADQVVRMDASGKPVAGQIALRKLKAGGWSGGAAMIDKP